MSQLKANKRFSIMFQHSSKEIPRGAIREEVHFIIPLNKDFSFKKKNSFFYTVSKYTYETVTIITVHLLETDYLIKRY